MMTVVHGAAVCFFWLPPDTACFPRHPSFPEVRRGLHNFSCSCCRCVTQDCTYQRHGFLAGREGEELCALPHHPGGFAGCARGVAAKEAPGALHSGGH